jgi:hypothetical protein
VYAYLSDMSDIASGLLYYRKQHEVYLDALMRRGLDDRDVDATESTKQPGEHEGGAGAEVGMVYRSPS